MIYLCHGRHFVRLKLRSVLGLRGEKSDLVSLLFFWLQNDGFENHKRRLLWSCFGSFYPSDGPMVGVFLRKLCGFSIPNFQGELP